MDSNTIGLHFEARLPDESSLVGIQLRHWMEISSAAAWSEGFRSLIAIMPIGQKNIGTGMTFFNHERSRIRTLRSQQHIACSRRGGKEDILLQDCILWHSQRHTS
jgi:hypothetical protein